MNRLLGELYIAYREARKHKRNTQNQLDFERNLESNLLALAYELQNRTYVPLSSICFINEKPVKREIVFIRFLTVSLFLIATAAGWARVLTLVSIESRLLLLRKVKILAERGNPDKELCTFLIRTFVFNDPLKNARFRSPRRAWNDLPANKSLMGLPQNQGLPIGNLTSQLFGNIYLNPLDQFVKRVLKIRCYGRYVDDMVLVHHDKCVLLDAVEQIRNFVTLRLTLKLHPKKVYLQPVQNGFAFLGVYILPWRVYPGRRIVRNFRECVANPSSDLFCQAARLLSYRGYMGHYDAWNLLTVLNKN